MIDYPNKLNNIFDKLNLFHIKPIIVGGYIRDKLLNLDSKDIDIELYGIDSLFDLENILQEFGSPNMVGKSFGVCKLSFAGLDLDFSLPRKDNKTGSGHKGFSVTTDKNLDFKTASSRRDFTINAIGYDIFEKTLLDPFDGLKDLETKTLRAVDIERFDEDPLRALRAVQFSTRLKFRLQEELFVKCKDMIKQSAFKELPRERVFEEFKKLLLKSSQPADGIQLLKELDAFSFFEELLTLKSETFQHTLYALNLLASYTLENKQTKLTLMLALLSHGLCVEDINSFLERLTGELKLIKDVQLLIRLSHEINIDKLDDVNICILATKIEIKSFLPFLRAINLGKKDATLESIKYKAKDLGVYLKAMPALLHGKDLIALGLRPSESFSKILNDAYTSQLKGEFKTKESGLEWLKSYLLS
jgi:tRNA nucleotidyltransferase (CCA-adding enzyme)